MAGMARYLVIFESSDNRHHSMLADHVSDLTYMGQPLEPGAIVAAFGQDWLITDLADADGELPQVTCTLYRAG
jgi:hypothetical protein